MEKHRITAEHAPQIKGWFATRGGIAVWPSINLSNPGGSWSTPATAPDGGPPIKPTWQAASEPRIITDPADVLVDVPREVKRFRVAVRTGDQGLSLKLTDGSTRKVRKAVVRAGEGSWYEFDYSTQEAVIFVADTTVPLSEWTG